MRVLIKTKLSPHKLKTPEGYLICQDAVLARTGPQEYMEKEVYPDSDSEKCIMVDRCPEDVFSPETLASFENKPLTCEHPTESVTPENFRDLAVGWVRDIRRGTFEGQDVMLANVIVTDPDSISEIEQGIRDELSCGYDCDVTKGEHPKQTNIRGNHVALCERGRAGIARIIDSKTIKDAGDCEYTVTSYYDDRFRGKEDDLVTDDWDKVKSFAWEKVQEGYPCKITERFSHRMWIADPKDLSQFVKDIDRVITEVEPKEITVADSYKSPYAERLALDLGPEHISETESEITLQFPSKSSGERSVYVSKYKNVPYTTREEESSYYITFTIDDLNDFFYDTERETVEKVYDNVKYVIYADGTYHNGTALFWFGNMPARYCAESEAPKFTKDYTEKIIARTGGKYKWIAKSVNADSAKTIAYKVLNKKYQRDMKPDVKAFLGSPEAIVNKLGDEEIFEHVTERDVLFDKEVGEKFEEFVNKDDSPDMVQTIVNIAKGATEREITYYSLDYEEGNDLTVVLFVEGAEEDDPVFSHLIEVLGEKLNEKYKNVNFAFIAKDTPDGSYVEVTANSDLVNDFEWRSHKFYKNAIARLQEISDRLDASTETLDDKEDSDRLRRVKSVAKKRIDNQIYKFAKEATKYQ